MLTHAVVVGGGIAGLLAAHALAPHAARVTLLERHAYPVDDGVDAPPARRGAPQSRCLHLLMASGAATLDRLSPGWRDDLLARGAEPFDVARDASLHLREGRMPRVPSGIIAYAGSRALLEAVLRARLHAHPHVVLREHCQVLGLATEPGGRRVTGLRIAPAEAILDADLVVDAGGRHSALPRWLAGAPGVRPAELSVASGTHYVSRWVRPDPRDTPDWHCFSTAPEPGNGRSAMMLRAERDRWGVVLLARLGERLPKDDAGFLAFTAQFGEGELHAVLRRAAPLSPIHRYPPSPNRLRRYDLVPAWPEGLVAIGDGVCALDPFHGLGMTAAARGALCLADHLGGGGRGGVGFQHALASVLAEPWGRATGCRLDGTPLPRDAAALSRIHAAAAHRADAAHAVLSAQHLLITTDEMLKAFAA